ncbi:DegT/DnrJ/EryC1/StrS family aminotransferase, partial [Candidatus Poribacteria bacterium]|nr:DegT/DnrJ/EryC1/StrS family aminotransferase [Candidatus Poribacteria bacterium]
AALGLAQLEQIDKFIAQRRAIAQFYQRELRGIPGITVCDEADWAFNVHWLSWILVEKAYGKRKDELLKTLNERQIEARSFFIPLHTLPPYRKYQVYQIDHAPQAYEKGLNLPSHVTLTEADLEIVVGVIREA